MSYIAAFVTGKIFEEVRKIYKNLNCVGSDLIEFHFLQTSLLILTVLSGVYLIVFITLGCFIFAGTEKV